MKSADYWRGRFSALEKVAQHSADKCVSELEVMYLEAQRTVQADIERWYGRFASNNGVSLTEARKMLTAGQLEEFKWDVEKYIQIGQQASLSPEWMKKLENASTRFHISRLEAVQLQIQQQIELLYGNQLDRIDGLLREVVSNGYTHTAYEIQKGLGLGWDITALDQKRLDTLLSRPWTADRLTFRDRCWTGKANLVSGIQSTMTQGILRGDRPARMTEDIRKRFGVSRYQAGRLAHTEAAYFSVRSSLEAFHDTGVEQVEVLETLDGYTCEICGSMDGKVIPLSQCEPGVTVPPFHPHCRGDVCPHMDDNAGKRIARDVDDEVYYVPSDMDYTTWKHTFVDGGAKDGLTLIGAGGILDAQRKSKTGGPDVHTVGHIDVEKYRCITDDIATDEVIITDERIQHIKERHPGDYERYIGYIPKILAEPDYILEANKSNTGVILKEIEESGEKFKVILRVKVESDPADYKNSILSFWHIGETTWNKNVKNKKILYKRG